MQCNQPLFCAGFQNNPQFTPYHTQSQYPDVIGEGDVLSYVLPDGSVQCYFVPTNRRERWIPYYTNSFMPNVSPIWFNNNKEVWFVRSILNTCPGAGPTQLSCNYGDAFSRTNFNTPSYSFVQKFHNDCWTSTTDLQYFFPPILHNWAKGCAAIQVEIPKEEKTIFHYGTTCNRPCYCNHKLHLTPDCVESDCTGTPMCIDNIKSTHSCCDASSKKDKKCNKNKNHSCACPSEPQVDTADKVITTYMDQAISCSDMREYKQAGKRKILKTDRRRNIETDVWYPRRKSKKNNARCSSDAIACNSACCLGSACSDTEHCDNT